MTRIITRLQFLAYDLQKGRAEIAGDAVVGLGPAKALAQKGTVEGLASAGEAADGGVQTVIFVFFWNS